MYLWIQDLNLYKVLWIINLKLTDAEIDELNALVKKLKLNLPFNKKIVERHTGTYVWLQKNISERNEDKLTPRIKELLELK